METYHVSSKKNTEKKISSVKRTKQNRSMFVVKKIKVKKSRSKLITEQIRDQNSI